MARLDFANARVGARRSRLLGAAALKDLLARPTPEARLERLRALPVGAALPPDLGEDRLAGVEAALREAVGRETLRLVAAAESPRARALLEAWLRLDEAVAVKAVLRAVQRRAALEEALAAAPPTPALAPETLRAAAGALTVEEAVAILADAGSPLAGPLRAHLPLDAERGVLPLEIAADRAAVEEARRACRHGEDGAVLRRHLEDRVDVRNAETLLALAGAPPGCDAFVPGGRRLPEATFRALAAAGAAGMRSGLARLFPGTGGAAAPWAAERALERGLILALRREARLRPLSIAVPIAYLAERRAEVRRIAIVLRGAALELPPDDVLDLVEA